MIELNNKTEQDFLNREYCEKLQSAGIDMSDAKYFICGNFDSDHKRDYIGLKQEYPTWNNKELFDKPISTYTLSELLLKLNEWPYNEHIKIEPESGGGLTFFKDAPFYCFFYENWKETQDTYSEYPLYAAANLLLWCAKNNVDYVKDVSDK